MTKSKNLTILGLLFVLGLSIRLAFISQIPWGINADEAAFGYNAYSFLKTTFDEWGKFPIYIKSFGEYKLPGYFFFSLPIVYFLNLNILSTRLLSVIAGSFLPIILFFLVKHFSQNKRLSFLSAFSLSIMPAAIHFSRAAFESNLALIFIALACLTWLKDKKLISFVLMFFAFYTYNSIRILLPFLILLLYLTDFLGKKSFYSLKKSLLFIILIYTSFFLTLLTNPHLMSRFKGLSFWQQPGFSLTQVERRNDHPNPNSLTVKLLHNKATEFSKTLVTNYFNHFQFKFLLNQGDPIDRLSFPKSGLISFWQILFTILGFLITLITYRKRINSLFLGLFFLAPIASATTFQTPSIIRSLLIILPLAYFTGLGLDQLYQSLKSKFWRFSFLLIFLPFLWYSFSFNLHNYLADYDHFLPRAFQPGYQQAVAKMNLYQKRYDKVVFTKAYGQPYIFVLFFQKYDPKKYQSIKKQATTPGRFGFLTVNQFDKYYFVDQINWQSYCSPTTLCIGTPRELDPDNPQLIILDKVYHQNKKDIIFVLATKKS